MVFKGSLYILNLLCGIVPCEHKFSYPDTSSIGPQLSGELHNATYESDLVNFDGTGNGNSGLLRNNANYSSNEDPLLVNTTSGMIKGYWMVVVGGRRIRAFEGIPYAEPPLNGLRFKAPIPVRPWDDVLEANLKGPKCLQHNDILMSRVIGSENCLYLNVYSKKLKSGKDTRKQPVIIYIHGGGFLTGSGGDFGPSYLLQRDVVLVTINYRLGVLGFMSTGDEESPGNFGLKDQSEAINWVHENIENFDGDHEKITLLGHGSGGVSVHLHMISFKARGKFFAGISISGNAFTHQSMHTMQGQALNLTKQFAKAMHCSIHGTTASIVECLQNERGSSLVKRQIQLLDTWPVPISLFRPVVENEYQKEDPFLTESPEEAYRKGTVDLMPWICGQAEDEGYSFLLSHLALGTFNTLRSKWNTLAPDFLNYNDLPVDQDEITRRVNWLYFRRVTPELAPIKTFSDALGARLMQTGVHKALQAHSQHAEAYGFMFAYKGKYNLGETARVKSTDWAVGHGEILGYILNSTTTYPGFKKNDSELMLSNILVNLLYNFANTRVPSFTTGAGSNFHVWSRITDPRNMTFLRIDKQMKMIPEPYLQQTLYWESLGLPDSLPLANFSSEIQNISDPLANGFVSTDITVTGGSVPNGLLPPVELTKAFEFSNNITTTPPSTETQTTVISTILPAFIPIPTPTGQQPATLLSLTTSAKPFRWLAQDFSPPTSTLSNYVEDPKVSLVPPVSTISSYMRDPMISLLPPVSTISSYVEEPNQHLLPPPLTTSSYTARPPTRNLNQNQGQNIFANLGNLFSGISGNNNGIFGGKNKGLFSLSGNVNGNRVNSEGLPQGLSVPILSGISGLRDFVTKSNFAANYLHSVSNEIAASNGRRVVPRSSDEIMITAASRKSRS